MTVMQLLLTVTLVKTCLSKITKVERGDIYPWGKASVFDRQEDILETLRSGMSLDLKKDIFDESAVGGLILRNLEGEEFRIETAVNHSTTNLPVPQKPITSKSALNKLLDGLCAFFNKDYWSFEWCFHRDIRQVHIELVEGKIVRNPEWSLGMYDSTAVIRKGIDPNDHSAPITKMLDFHENGQKCDEINDYRKTTVIYQCCAPTTSTIDAAMNTVDMTNSHQQINTPLSPQQQQQSIKKSQRRSSQQQQQHSTQNTINPADASTTSTGGTVSNIKTDIPAIYIQNIEENQICQYEMIICVPQLCIDSTNLSPTSTPSPTLKSTEKEIDSKTATTTTKENTGNSDDKNGDTHTTSTSKESSSNSSSSSSSYNLVHIINMLQRSCLYRQVEWWTYELCLGHGIRQFHMKTENIEQANGIIKQHQMIETQFSLGEAPIEKYTNNSELLQAAGLLLKSSSSSSSSSTATTTSSTTTYHTSDQITASTSLSSTTPPSMKLLPNSGMPVEGFGKGKGPKFISLEFLNGTPCDISQLNRSTSVHISCGSKEMITDIIEDRTCHYNMKVTTPMLCHHTEFAPTKQEIRTVAFVPVNPSIGEEEDNSDNDEYDTYNLKKESQDSLEILHNFYHFYKTLEHSQSPHQIPEYLREEDKHQDTYNLEKHVKNTHGNTGDRNVHINEPQPIDKEIGEKLFAKSSVLSQREKYEKYRENSKYETDVRKEKMESLTRNVKQEEKEEEEEEEVSSMNSIPSLDQENENDIDNNSSNDEDEIDIHINHNDEL